MSGARPATRAAPPECRARVTALPALPAMPALPALVALAALGSAALGPAAGCGGRRGVPADTTALEVHVLYDEAALQPAWFRLQTIDAGAVLFDDFSPSTPATVHSDWIVVLLLPDDLVGRPLDLDVTGLDAGGAVLARGGATAYLIQGEVTVVDVTLVGGACTPDEVWCDGDDVVRCEASGQPAVEQTCTTACRDGACTACTPGATECAGAVLTTCDANGDPASMTDCTSADPCVVGTCDPAMLACVASPAAEGDPCNDGLFCTTGETCQGGVCTGGGATDCSAVADTCNTGICNDVTDACDPLPANEGGACDDGLSCTMGETCSSGACAGGAPMDCSGLDDDCNVGACDEGSGGCTAVATNEGGACLDGDFCTLGETCAAGACLGGSPPDCTAFDGACSVGACEPATGLCFAMPANAGDPCDDGDACTSGDACAGIYCSGSAPACLPADIRLNELYGGTPDFFELVNNGACTCDLGGWSVTWDLCSNGPFDIPGGTNVAGGGGVLRLMELSTAAAPNEINTGVNICDNVGDAGWVMLCSGTCDLAGCTNVMDYYAKANTTTMPTGMPACVSFTPAPVDVSAIGSTQSAHRIAFAGTGPNGQQSDWSLSANTRD